MSQCLAKPREGTYKPRSQGGQGMGSHSVPQALLWPSVVYVQNPNERMGIGQDRLPPQRVCQPARYRLRVRLREGTHCPPPVRPGSVGVPRNFSSLFSLVCKLAN